MFLENILFNVDIESLHDLPSNVYLKNYNGITLYCNEYQAKSAGVAKADNLIKTNSYDYLDDDMSAIIRNTDEDIIKKNKPSVIFESAVLDQKKCTYLSYKIPLITQKKKMVCLFGLSIPLGDKNALIRDSASSDILKNSDYIRTIIQKNDFNFLESECLYYFIFGMPLKSIARQLSLISERTVEYYLDNMKNKYSCATHVELVVKVLSNHSRQ